MPSIQRALAGRKRRKDELDKVAAELIQMFVKKQQPPLRRQDKINGQLNLFCWNCPSLRIKITETKNSYSPSLAKFSYWLHDDKLGHVTKRGINTQRSGINFSCSLPIACLINRRQNFLPLTSIFSYPLTFPNVFFFWTEPKQSETIPICVLAETQLQLINFF